MNGNKYRLNGNKKQIRPAAALRSLHALYTASDAKAFGKAVADDSKREDLTVAVAPQTCCRGTSWVRADAVDGSEAGDSFAVESLLLR